MYPASDQHGGDRKGGPLPPPMGGGSGLLYVFARALFWVRFFGHKKFPFLQCQLVLSQIRAHGQIYDANKRILGFYPGPPPPPPIGLNNSPGYGSGSGGYPHPVGPVIPPSAVDGTVPSFNYPRLSQVISLFFLFCFVFYSFKLHLRLGDKN